MFQIKVSFKLNRLNWFCDEINMSDIGYSITFNIQFRILHLKQKFFRMTNNDMIFLYIEIISNRLPFYFSKIIHTLVFSIKKDFQSLSIEIRFLREQWSLWSWKSLNVVKIQWRIYLDEKKSYILLFNNSSHIIWLKYIWERTDFAKICPKRQLLGPYKMKAVQMNFS